jgi:hypothetical protein
VDTLEIDRQLQDVDSMYPVIGCGVFVCGITLSVIRSLNSVMLSDSTEGKSPRKRFGHKAAFLAIKSWSKRMHRRSCSRTDRISQCSSVDICPKANETSSEAESVSSESFEDDITPKRPPKGIHWPRIPQNNRVPTILCGLNPIVLRALCTTKCLNGILSMKDLMGCRHIMHASEWKGEWQNTFLPLSISRKTWLLTTAFHVAQSGRKSLGGGSGASLHLLQSSLWQAIGSELPAFCSQCRVLH